MALATPLYHGVALCRGLVAGHLGTGPGLAHLGYLVALTTLGAVLSGRTYRRRLVT